MSERIVASWKGWALILVLALCVAASGCSVRGYAMNGVADALAAGGSGFGSDDDIELIGAAAPFSLKMMESVLAEIPDHRELLLATAQGFARYAYAYVEMKADEMEDADLQAAYVQRERARRLYLRARDYGLRGIEVARPGFKQALQADPARALASTDLDDVGLLYWTGASWAAAIALSKDDPFLLADLPVVEALMRRALELDEAFEHGSLHVFLIHYEMGRAGLSAGASARARRHFARALELGGGMDAAPYVAFAEAVCLAERNRTEFENMLQHALRLDVYAKTERRLANLVMQRRARWLLGRTDRLFSD
jgi:predicted anti-sigma-YlaC factor YlaD